MNKLLLNMVLWMVISPSVLAINFTNFTGIGDLQGGEFSSEALDISADGSVIVGRSSSEEGTEAFRYEKGVISGLGDFPGGEFFSEAFGVSADGSIVVGRSSSEKGTIAFRYDHTSPNKIKKFHIGGYYSEAYDVSADGSVIVGTRYTIRDGIESFLYDYAEDSITRLHELPNAGKSISAIGISADSSVLIGSSIIEQGSEAFRYENEQLNGLGELSGGSFHSQAFGISADGSVVVGRSNSEQGSEAFRYENDEMTGLGELPGGNYFSEANDVSADGSIVVGSSDGDNGIEAVFWDEQGKIQSLKKTLLSAGINEISKWQLKNATAISDDGTTIVGTGINPDGFTEAFVVTSRVSDSPVTYKWYLLGLIILASVGLLILKKNKPTKNTA